MSNSINTSFGASKSPPSPIPKSPIMPSQMANYLPYNNKPKLVASNWDRDNPPPQELEAMLNILGEIYHHNNNFCSKLKQIGTDLLSAKELGDTLISWIKVMEGSYSAYCQNYMRGVDLWPEIDNNLSLQQTLNAISAQKNKPVTLDFLFDAPLKRIHYYKKFYMRILKSSEPGRSDYNILAAANKRIDYLIELEKNAKENNKRRENDPLLVPQPVMHTFISSTNSQGNNITVPEMKNPKTAVNVNILELERQAREMNNTEEDIIPLPVPQSVVHTFISPVNTQGNNIIVSDIKSQKSQNTVIRFTLPELENQIDTSRVMDLFTKQPKKLNIQLLPPNLPFKREIILNSDFIVILPDGDGSDNHRAHTNAHLILFTDLLIICQRLTPEEKKSNPTKEFWLLYPPLSARHLTLNDIHDDKEAIAKSKINTNVSPILLNSQPSPSTQESYQMSPNKSNSQDSGRALSPRSPSAGQGKLGLPSSPLSNSSPLLRTRSPEQIRIASPPSLRTRSPEIRNASPSNFLPIRGIQEQIQERSNSVESLDSISSIASFIETIQQTPPCEVSCWVLGEWVPITKKEKCIVEIKMTSLNKPCWVVLLESSERMVLNSWILSTTTLYRDSINSLSVSCETGKNTEYYKVTLTNVADADRLFSNFQKMKNYGNNELGIPQVGFISRSSSLKNNQQPSKEIEQTLTDVMESRVKLFLQNDHGVWTNLGWGNMKLLLEVPSHRKRIIIQSEKQKSKFVDAFICETGVAKGNKSSVTFKINIGESAKFIYMMQMKSEANAAKALEIMRTEQRT
ncbi:4651_t:CDS:2 [Rhizophagus irregularis]|nr:4651_t:CDS:2 [Rhizophagus irregularis]